MGPQNRWAVGACACPGWTRVHVAFPSGLRVDVSEGPLLRWKRGGNGAQPLRSGSPGTWDSVHSPQILTPEVVWRPWHLLVSLGRSSRPFRAPPHPPPVQPTEAIATPAYWPPPLTAACRPILLTLQAASWATASRYSPRCSSRAPELQQVTPRSHPHLSPGVLALCWISRIPPSLHTGLATP